MFNSMVGEYSHKIHLLREIKEYLPIGHRVIYFKRFLQPRIVLLRTKTIHYYRVSQKETEPA